VYSRDRLNEDDYLENVKILNSPSRARDAEWTDWVNLSVSRVNKTFLGYSKGWHSEDGVWWACLSFDIAILDDADVWFCTGNNAHTATARAQGVSGFEAMFAPSVEWGMRGSVHTRTASTPESWTTDPQAEVLYPRAITLDHLRAVYVPEPELGDAVAGVVGAVGPSSPFDLSNLAVEVRPDIFQ
jgi:hypothetical protein